MGLDQYAFKVMGGVDEPDLEDGEREDLHYWRKHPDLHGWMQRLYAERTGIVDPGEFNCVPLELYEENLDALEKDIRDSALPATSGFFFGDSRDNVKDDLEFIYDARVALREGYRVFYSSWW